jgi:tetratricopeptide (TPR) repeat protein
MQPYLKLFAAALGLLVGAGASTRDARSRLLDLRSLAYDANFRNEAVQLQTLSQQLAELSADADVGAAALYYAGWTDWALFNSEFDAGRKEEARAAIVSAVERFRRLVALTPDDADAQAMLANALIGLAFATPDGFRTVREELTRARHRAVELGPTNPRVVLMDAGMVFGTPPAAGGSQEKGLQRWLQAIELFESEAHHAAPNPLAPRWGRALAYGWLCQLYLSTTPPRRAEAKVAAATALSLRPDFWYVRERILPRLGE